MEITCAQMDVLISFYIEGDLSTTLKTKVEEHLRNCSECRAKYEIIKNMIDDLKETLKHDKNNTTDTLQYQNFKDNLSAYIDNELPTNENIKIKKYTINNKNARKELEDTYHIRKLISESFSKSEKDVKHDFAKKILKKLNPNDEDKYKFNPAIKIVITFSFVTLILSAIIIFTLTI